MPSRVQFVAFRGLDPAETVALPGNTVAGNTIVVLMTWSYNGCPPSFTDTQGNTYTVRGTHPRPGGAQYFWIFTAPVGSSAACTLTLSAACGLSVAGVVIEVSGLVAGNCFDVLNVNESTANPCQAGSITPSANNAYIAALFYRDTSPLGLTAGTGFTELGETADGFSSSEDMVQSTAAAINPEMTAGAVSAGFPVWGYAAAFTAAAVAPAAPVLEEYGFAPMLATPAQESRLW